MTAFNRPTSLTNTLQALRQADLIEDYRILISVDGGPHADHEGIHEVVVTFDDLEIEIIYQDENLGCAGNTGWILTHAFADSTVQDIIFIDDSTQVASDALHYFRTCLDRYREDERVFAVNGYNRRGSNDLLSTYSLCNNHMERGDPARIFLSDYFICAGWAIWRRIWEELEESEIGWFGTHLCSHPHDDKPWMWEHIGRNHADPTGSWAFPFNFYWRAQRAVVSPDVARVQDGCTAAAEWARGFSMTDAFALNYVFSEYWMGDGYHEPPTEYIFEDECVIPSPLKVDLVHTPAIIHDDSI